MNIEVANDASSKQVEQVMLTSRAIYAKELRIQGLLDLLSHLDLRNTVSVETLAKQMNLSASRLRHLFTQATGVSLGRYLKQMRFDRARYLMLHSRLTVKEVTTAVGINDVSHFVRDYKALYGARPSESRRNCSTFLRLKDGRLDRMDNAYVEEISLVIQSAISRVRRRLRL